MSDEKTYARYREEDKRQMRDDARKVLSTPEGRRLLMAVIGIGGVYAPVGPCGGSPVELAYATARRDAASDLLAFCNGASRENVQLAAEERTQLTIKREHEIASRKE
jgi:hypothetical protein